MYTQNLHESNENAHLPIQARRDEVIYYWYRSTYVGEFVSFLILFQLFDMC